MRLRQPLLLVLLAGCASGGSGGALPTSSGAPTTTTTVVTSTTPGVDGSTDIAARRDDSGVTSALAMPVERAWTALIAAYGSLDIQPANVDVQRRVYCNQAVEPRSGRVAGLPITQLLNCGFSPTGAPLAQTAQVRLSVVSVVEAAGAGASRLVTRVQGVATSRDGSSTQVTCGSTGRLERRIAEQTGQVSGQ
ncbi:MAG TPA: hypothetical protein VEA99_11690 [Gemmatimonadaceae bacterium]|nr:hypothetical protein [Gemmatimonadaceae bacterium]